jgi:hypothetical protein
VIKELGLFDLLAPYYLLGFTFPNHIQDYLATLHVKDFRTAIDETDIVISGRAVFDGDSDRLPTLFHIDPNGVIFSWEDIEIDFRLKIRRRGSSDIHDAASNLPNLANLLDILGTTGAAQSDYPGFAYTLELLFSYMSISLGPNWLPGELDESGHRIIASTDPKYANEDVRFYLPFLLFEFDRDNDVHSPSVLRPVSFGNPGFDAPHDLSSGELIRMEPPEAMHKSGRFGFGIGPIMIDLNTEHTPPEILEFFGTDEYFRGFYSKSARFYFELKDLGLGFNLGTENMLISFDRDVWYEVYLDYLFSLEKISADVRFFDGEIEIPYSKGIYVQIGPPVYEIDGGTAKVPTGAIMQVSAIGGIPPFTFSINITNNSGLDIEVGNQQQIILSDYISAPGMHKIVVTVTDSADPDQNTFKQTIIINPVPALPQPPPSASTVTKHVAAILQEPIAYKKILTDGSVEDLTEAPDRYSIELENLQLLEVRLKVDGPSPLKLELFEESPNGGIDPKETFVFTPDKPPKFIITDDSEWYFKISFPALPLPHSGSIPDELNDTFSLLFNYNKPDDIDIQNYAYDKITDDQFDKSGSEKIKPYANAEKGAERLIKWLKNAILVRNRKKSIIIEGYASFEADKSDAEYNIALSQRRINVVKKIIERIIQEDPDLDIEFEFTESPKGFNDALAEYEENENYPAENFRVAKVKGQVYELPEVNNLYYHQIIAIGRISRGPSEVETKDPPPPAKPASKPPPGLRKLGFRCRVERNWPVLFELYGEFDVETRLEAKLREELAKLDQPSTGQLGITNVDTNAHPDDGVFDVTLTFTFDPAINKWNGILQVGSAPGDVDGLLQMENYHYTGQPLDEKLIRNLAGALVVFAPITQNTIESLDPEHAGNMVALIIEFALLVFIAEKEIFRTKKLTLYGIEARFGGFFSPEPEERLTEATFLVDCGVEFDVYVKIGGTTLIETKNPAKVRYKAIGFSIYRDSAGEPHFRSVFDTSKGYSIDLGDLGNLALPDPLDDLVKIAAVRMSQFNPMVLEIDLAPKINLGIINVDKFLVKVPIDTDDPIMVLPGAIRVNIPGVLSGRGSLTFNADGCEGSLDLSLEPVNIRIAASVGVQKINTPNRKATGVYISLVVEFPTPIPLACSGAGLFGLSGLFAMHFRRLEQTTPPPDADFGPALQWLMDSYSEGGPSNIANWEPHLDKWSFGVGAKIGTLEGGFLVQLRGLLVVELPGPRIIIFIKMQVLQRMGELEDPKLLAGLLGVVDLDFNLNQITIGIFCKIDVKKLIVITIPIEIFFDLDDVTIWHVHLGRVDSMVSAYILNIVRARGYFMIQGETLKKYPGDAVNFPLEDIKLPGIMVAFGIEASISMGKKKIRLYIELAAGAHVGISFSPFRIAGFIFLDGALHIFFITLEISAKAALVALPKEDKLYVYAEVCARIRLLWFTIKGCVKIKIGSEHTPCDKVDLVSNVYLQSFAPVLTQGQGGERPIDASLGDAVSSYTDTNIPIVPIDSVPVIQFTNAPFIPDDLVTFTKPLDDPPNLKDNGGWVPAGGKLELKYVLSSITLFEVKDDGSEDEVRVEVEYDEEHKPPATWRWERFKEESDNESGNGSESGNESSNPNVDLALFSRVPVPFERALERSERLDKYIYMQWGDACQPEAPQAPVLWTFCKQQLGPSGEGWHITGVPWPDPENMTRRSPVPTGLYVEEPVPAFADEILNVLIGASAREVFEPARIIGYNYGPGVLGTAERIDFIQLGPQQLLNPFTIDDVTFKVTEQSGVSPINANILSFGLDCRYSTEITLPMEASAVELLLFQRTELLIPQPATATAYDPDGNVVATVTMQPVEEHPYSQTLSLHGQSIVRITIICPDGLTYLRKLHYTHEPIQPQQASCRRALQLPSYVNTENNPLLTLPNDALNYANGRPNQQWINLHTGKTTAVKIFAAVQDEIYSETVIREFTGDGTHIKTSHLDDLDIQVVDDTFTNLPPEWTDTENPWYTELIPAAEFLAARCENMPVNRLLISFVPDEQCEIIRIGVDEIYTAGSPPYVIISAVEASLLTETERLIWADRIKGQRRQVLDGYMSQGEPVPLLKPDTCYELEIKYTQQCREKKEDGSFEVWPDPEDPNDLEKYAQTFRFQTDEKPPENLEPYVLCTAPNHEGRYHYYEDEVKIIFNDRSIVQLYNDPDHPEECYGYTLRAVVHSADGLDSPANDVQVIDLPRDLNTPFFDRIKDLIDSGELPCVGYTTQLTCGFPVPITLRPLMSYTIDIEAHAPDDVIKPLYRMVFETSRYASMDALAKDIRTQKVKHRVLNSRIAGLSAGINADREIQDALEDAGEQALPPPTKNQVVIYWVQNTDGSFSPNAILIDAIEPLWRTRSMPRLEDETVAFRRIQPKTVRIQRVVETSDDYIRKIIRSPGGTRTIAIIRSSFSAGTISLDLQSIPRSSPYEIESASATLLSLPFSDHAPWEVDYA